MLFNNLIAEGINKLISNQIAMSLSVTVMLCGEELLGMFGACVTDSVFGVSTDAPHSSTPNIFLGLAESNNYIVV